VNGNAASKLGVKVGETIEAIIPSQDKV